MAGAGLVKDASPGISCPSARLPPRARRAAVMTGPCSGAGVAGEEFGAVKRFDKDECAPKIYIYIFVKYLVWTLC